jgi:hypothetical protein
MEINLGKTFLLTKIQHNSKTLIRALSLNIITVARGCLRSFCSSLCNYGMVIKTEPKASRLGANLIGCHFESQPKNHIYWVDVDAVYEMQ